jgi:hypothetical protein
MLSVDETVQVLVWLVANELKKMSNVWPEELECSGDLNKTTRKPVILAEINRSVSKVIVCTVFNIGSKSFST